MMGEPVELNLRVSGTAPSEELYQCALRYFRRAEQTLGAHLGWCVSFDFRNPLPQKRCTLDITVEGGSSKVTVSEQSENIFVGIRDGIERAIEAYRREAKIPSTSSILPNVTKSGRSPDVNATERYGHLPQFSFS